MTRKKTTPKVESEKREEPMQPALASAEPEPEARTNPASEGTGDAAPAQPTPPRTLEDVIGELYRELKQQREYMVNLANDHNRLKEKLSEKPAPSGGGAAMMLLSNPEVQSILKGLAQSFIGGGSSEKPKDGLEALIGEELTAEFRQTLRQAVKDKYSLLTEVAKDLKDGKAKVVRSE